MLFSKGMGPIGVGVFIIISISSVAFAATAPATAVHPTVQAPQAPALTPWEREGLSRALRAAALEGEVEAVERSLKGGASINATNGEGQNPLTLATLNGNLEVVQALVAKKANVNFTDPVGRSALMQAAQKCDSDVVNVLLKAGARVNAQDHNGKTAMILASEEGCVPVVRSLLKVKGIQLNRVDSWQLTAFDYARREGSLEVGGPFEEIMGLLRRSGAMSAGALSLQSGRGNASQ